MQKDEIHGSLQCVRSNASFHFFSTYLFYDFIYMFFNDQYLHTQDSHPILQFEMTVHWSLILFFIYHNISTED